ncbi:MAG: hypothetical protein LBU23_04525, partial [Planctomycetota bacterium]|nr:hypothetical protein [Planctomycetota bacterium]
LGIRDWFIKLDREDDFTRLQGEVYGPGLANAPPYPGALACLARLEAAGARSYLVSHKTRTPVLGPSHDLRRAARDWLADNGFPASGLFPPDRVFFEDSLAGKAGRIARLGCDHFIDDMERFLLSPDFPAGVEKILFRPEGAAAGPGLAVFASWAEIESHLAARLRREARPTPCFPACLAV